MTDIERLSAQDYAPRKGLVYIDTAGLHTLYSKIAFRGNHILVGPTGGAKSLSLQTYAEKIGCPIITYDCSEDVRRSNLIGSFIIRGEETPFILGPIPTAFEIANEVGQCMLVFEECNSLSSQAQKILNSTTDIRRRVEVPEAKRVFQLQKDKKLWVVGTMNPSVYSGVYSLNQDLKSRFRLISVNYPKRADEVKILKTLLGEVEKELPQGAIERLVLLAHETRQGAFEYSLSTRDLFQISEDAVFLGLQKSLWISCGKFEGDDTEAYKKRVESIFDDVRLTSNGAKKTGATSTEIDEFIA